jgi:hypothetical protein
MRELSAGAKKLLSYFKEKGLAEKQFEAPAPLLALFDDPAECEAAQQELERLGFLTVAPPLPPYPSPRVRAAALTRSGLTNLKSQFD